MKTFIQEEAERQGVDPDLILRIAQVESNINQNSKSKKGARGIMQLMPTTAKKYKGNIDNPHDNVRMGVSYFKEQLERFNNDPHLALAAYNAGPTAVIKHNGIPPYKETQAYVNKIMRPKDGSDIFSSKVQSGEDIFKNTPKEQTTPMGGSDIFQVKQEEPKDLQPAEKLQTHLSAKLLGKGPAGFAGRTLLGAANLALLEPLQLGLNIGDKIGNLPIVKKPLIALMEALDAPKYDIPNPKEKINSLITRLEELKKEGGHEGFDWAGLLGGVGMGLKGLARTKGATKLGSQIQTYLTSTPKTLKGAMVQGAATGALLGRAPVTSGDNGYFEQKIPQVMAATAVGGVIPGAIGGLSKTLDFAKRVRALNTPEGVDTLTATILKQAAGEDKQKIINLLQNPQDFLPGSKSTVGEYAANANNPTFAGLQEIVAPHAANAFYGVHMKGEHAIKNAIDSIAKTPAIREAAYNLRRESTSPLYREAKQSTNYIDASSLLSKVDDILGDNKHTPKIFTPVDDIKRRLLEIKDGGNKPKDFISLSDGIQDKIKELSEGGIPLYNVKVLSEIKGDLDTIIRDAVKPQKEAETLFQSLSGPVNRIDVGQYLKDKLIPAINDEGGNAAFRASTFAQAQRDAPKTVEKATGFYKPIKDILTPEEYLLVKGIQKELGRKAKYKNLASHGKVEAQNLIDNLFPKIPSIGMFSQLYSVGRAGVSGVENSARDKVFANISKIMDSNPAKVAELLSSLPPQEKQKLLMKLA